MNLKKKTRIIVSSEFAARSEQQSGNQKTKKSIGAFEMSTGIGFCVLINTQNISYSLLNFRKTQDPHLCDMAEVHRNITSSALQNN